MSQAEIEIIRVLGCIGALGSFLIMVSDWIGWTKRVEDKALAYDGTGIGLSRFAEQIFLNQRGISAKRRYFGGVMGIICMPLWLCGLAPVYIALSPAGVGSAAAVIALMAVFFGWGHIGHGNMALINEMLDTTIGLDRSSKAFEVVAKNIRRATQYWTVTALFPLVCFLIGSLLMSFLMLTQETLYPAGLAFFNLFLVVVFFRRRLFLPNSISRWTGPACVHLFAFFPFIVFSTALTWNGV